MKPFLGLVTCVALCAACGSSSGDEDVGVGEGAASRKDSIESPTDTKVTLQPGLWHDDTLSVAEGWHLYHFTPQADGLVAFQMKADPALATGKLWTYLRIVDTANNNEVWAAVADRKTNLTDVIVQVKAGKSYQVVATSQNNSTANDLGKSNQSEGAYTVSAMPLSADF